MVVHGRAIGSVGCVTMVHGMVQTWWCGCTSSGKDGGLW